jgi:hypothetical protein
MLTQRGPVLIRTDPDSAWYGRYDDHSGKLDSYVPRKLWEKQQGQGKGHVAAIVGYLKDDDDRDFRFIIPNSR